MKDTLSLQPGAVGAIWPLRRFAPLPAPHHHDELEFNLVTGGAARYLVDGRRYDISPQSMIWLYPEQEHLLLDASPDFRMWIVVFTPDLVRRCADEANQPNLTAPLPAGRFCGKLPAQEARWLRLCCERLAESAGSARDNAGLSFLLLEAWALFDRTARDQDAPELHPAVESAARLLQQGEPPGDLPALAKRAGLSPGRLSRLFKQETGVALAEYRNRTRLERFFSLFPDPRRTMLAAALEAGFGSYAQFHRVFKQATGTAPRSYFTRR